MQIIFHEASKFINACIQHINRFFFQETHIFVYFPLSGDLIDGVLFHLKITSRHF